MPSSPRSRPAALRIGSRGSPLALAQAEETRARLALVQPALAEPSAIEIVVIRTTGDRILDRPLADVGGKGLFTKEIDEALLDGRIDLAVHSVKDLPTQLPPSIILGATLAREDPRDALIAVGVGTLDALPAGCVVGTSSLRRQAQLLHHRSDLSVVPLRGNVATRLSRVTDGDLGATMLAMAGLIRLGRVRRQDHQSVVDSAETETVIRPVPVDVMLPAVGQGAIGVACREHDEAVRMLVAAIDDRHTHTCVIAERAMLEVLDGSCRTPIAGLAVIEDELEETLHLSGLIARPDGSQIHADNRRGGQADALALGHELGTALRAAGGSGFFAASP